MSTYIPSDEVLVLYTETSKRADAYARLAAAALSATPPASPARKEARAGLEQLARAIRAFYDSFSFAGDTTRDALGLGTEADRKQKAFLADFGQNLAAAGAALEKRLDQNALKDARAQDGQDPAARIKASAGDGAPDWPQVCQAALAAFDFFRSLASRLPAEAAKARSAKSAALDKELLGIKMRSFVDLANAMGARNAELLFKARTKFERLFEAGAALSTLQDRPAGSIGAERSASGFELSYEEAGVALLLRFARGAPAKYEGAVEGFVESNGAKAEFRVADPAASDAKAAAGSDQGTLYARFLARLDLQKLYETGGAALAKAEEDVRQAPARTAESLSKALDDIL